MTRYIGLIRKDADSDFGVDFPDFPGCVSAGATLDEARRLAQEALEFHVAGMLEDGDELPAPSSLAAIMAANFGVCDRRFRRKPAGGFGRNRQTVSVQSDTRFRRRLGAGLSEPPLRS